MPGSASSALPRTLAGPTQAATVPGAASPASKTAEPRPKEPAAGSAAPFCPPAPQPPWDRGSPAARGPTGSRRASTGPRLEDGRSAAAEPEQLAAHPGYLSVRTRCCAWWQGLGLGGLGHPPPFLAPAGAPAGRAAAAHPPSPPAGGARGGQALGPRAARRPPHLPRGARVSPPGHSPPQLSVLCSPAGNDLRKRLGQGLRQAAGARRGDVLGSRLPINYGWKQIRESQFCKSPRSGPGGVLRPGGSRRAAGRRRQRDEQEGRETFISS